MKLIFLGIYLIGTIANAMANDIVMKHMPEGNNCIICHEAKNPKQLFMRDGSKIDIAHVDELCGQCHGIKHRRWKDGRHGKVITSWRPELRERVTCIKCHDPHTPKFPKYESKAPPRLRGYKHE